MAEALSVDIQDRKLDYGIVGEQEPRTMSYDHLVLALGSVTRMPPVDGLRFWTGAVHGIRALRIAVLGTDCALGKRTTTTLLLIGLLVGIGVVAAGDVAAGGSGFDVFGFGYLVFVCSEVWID